MSHYAFQWAKRQCVGDSTTKTVLKTYANWASEDYSTWVTNEELLIDTELNIQTIRKARAKLIEKGYLIETDKRIGETRSIVVYQMVAPAGSTIVQAIDQRTGETISLSPPSREDYEAKTLQKRSPSKIGASSGKRAKRGEKPSPSKNEAPPDSTSSPSKSHVKGGEIPPQAPPNLEPNKADVGLESSSSSDAREADAVDNSLPLLPEDEQTEEPPHNADDIAPPDAEAQLLAWLAVLPNVAVDQLADRLLVLTWVGKGLTQVQLAEAHRRAQKRRDSKQDERAIGAKFLDCFVSEVLAAGKAQAEPSASQSTPWWESDSGINAQGRSKRVERRPNETTPDYLIRVAQASGRGPWIEHVLKRWQGTARYQSVIEFFGDHLLPVDFYAS
ncbi:hypothetical protein G3N59_01165 [Paraburkholderia sp. Ac-20340]|uniref:hypothetical protein n=1 Tax=Paraburkholderia sp. Ac-20340 TaxID=2703888 RepID=UPI00197F5288|nr:hypothetical protein [Paraburkholderia sp. Ac-20340]MBN3851977.1 hypothetical protein [Paraburkholderia sp. Ac-20340]